MDEYESLYHLSADVGPSDQSRISVCPTKSGGFWVRTRFSDGAIAGSDRPWIRLSCVTTSEAGTASPATREWQPAAHTCCHVARSRSAPTRSRNV